MSSIDLGKKEAVEWILKNIPQDATCLDVGACDGKWAQLVGAHLEMDGIEIFPRYVRKFKLENKYRKVFIADIRRFKYDHYDFIIFGDVLEHMTVEEAQNVIAYAKERCNQMLIAVPFLWEQGPIRGNPNEVHIQPDLTPELFDERYPGFKPIFMSAQYAYYVRDDV